MTQTPPSNAYNVAIQRLEMPDRFKRLPISDGGFPVPKFVSWIDGKADFRVVDGRWMGKAFGKRLCWLCGEKLGKHMAFVIGPMCAVNRTSSEPPSHLECAEYAAKACPFLTQPNRKRNMEGRSEEAEQPAGIMLERNPGVTLIWVTEKYTAFRAGDGVLFRIGQPSALQWWAKGRTATREEIMHSIETGLPALRQVAMEEGPNSLALLELKINEALKLVPA